MKCTFSPQRLLTQVIGLGAVLLLTHEVALGQCWLSKDGWEPVPEMSEEFDQGTTLGSLRTHWNFEFKQGPVANDINPNPTETYNKEANLHFENGYAYFETYPGDNTYINGHGDTTTYHYTSAVMVSKYDQFPGSRPDMSTGPSSGSLFGMYEIRCKLPGTSGQTPAFWLLSHFTWPPELDIFEFNPKNYDDPFAESRRSFTCTTHWARSRNGTYVDPTGCGGTYLYPYNLTDDFHTWTLVWTPLKVTWFFDGKELRSDDTPDHIPGSGAEWPYPPHRMAEHKMDLIIGSGLYNAQGASTFDPLIVDYIRVYRPAGLVGCPSCNEPQAETYFNNTLFPAYSTIKYKKEGGTWKLSSVDMPYDKDHTNYSNYHVKGNLQVCNNGSKFIYRGDYNLLWNSYYYDYNNGLGARYYSYPLDWNETVDNDVATGSNEDIIFYSHNNYLKYLENGSFSFAVNDLTGNYIANVAGGIKASADKSTVYYVGTDHNLYRCQRAQSGNWQVGKMTRTGNVTTNYAIDPNDNSSAYYVSTAHQLGYTSTPPVGPGPPNIISTQNDVDGALCITSDGTIHYRTTSGGIAYYSNSGSSWSRSQVTAIYPGSSSATPLNNVGAGLQVEDNPRQYHFIETGTTPRIWNVYQGNGNWYAVILDNTVNYAQNNLLLANQPSGTLCFVGSDQKIRRFDWSSDCEVKQACEALTYMRSGGQAPAASPLSTVSAKTEKAAIQVYPSPAQEYLMVDASALHQVQGVSIYTAHMQTLRRTSMEAGKATLDVRSLPAGLYYVKVTTDTQSYFVKFLKQ